MKYLLLAGTLGALMLLVLVPSVSNPAYANIFLIDNFTDDDIAMKCDKDREEGISAFETSTGLSDVIDMIRQCQLQILEENIGSKGEMTVVQSAGMFRQMSGDGVRTNVYLQYDGESNGGRSLALDFTDSDNLRIQYSRADFVTNVTARLIDSDGDIAELEGLLAGGTNTIKNLNFPLLDFVAANGALDLDDIDEINLNFTTDFDATDWTIEFIDITMQMIGGEMFPVDTTALLLAGAELNAIWILPAIAAIGIGAFVVTRKRNSS